MSKGNSVPAPAVIPLEKKYTQQQFIEAYQELCKKTGWQISAAPAFKALNDFGGSIITIQLGIVPFVEQAK